MRSKEQVPEFLFAGPVTLYSGDLHTKACHRPDSINPTRLISRSSTVYQRRRHLLTSFAFCYSETPTSNWFLFVKRRSNLLLLWNIKINRNIIFSYYSYYSYILFILLLFAYYIYSQTSHLPKIQVINSWNFFYMVLYRN